MAPRIHIVCQNHQDDRIIPRMARMLRDGLGWTLSAAPDPSADVLYLSGYFEATRFPWPDRPVAALFTHREEEPPNNAKARLWDDVARRVQLRVAMCKLYADPLSIYGPTVQPALPVERDRFVIVPKKKRSLATYANGKCKRPTSIFFMHLYARLTEGSTVSMPLRPAGAKVTDIVTRVRLSSMPLVTAALIVQLIP